MAPITAQGFRDECSSSDVEFVDVLFEVLFRSRAIMTEGMY